MCMNEMTRRIFLDASDKILEECVLSDNKWLDNLFKDRERWVLIHVTSINLCSNEEHSKK